MRVLRLDYTVIWQYNEFKDTTKIKIKYILICIVKDSSYSITNIQNLTISFRLYILNYVIWVRSWVYIVSDHADLNKIGLHDVVQHTYSTDISWTSESENHQL